MNFSSISSSPFLTPLQAPRPTVARPAAEGRHHPVRSPQPKLTGAVSRFSAPDDRIANGLTLGLSAVTVPAVAYALYQLWHLVGGETLNHAVRAFAQ